MNKYQKSYEKGKFEDKHAKDIKCFKVEDYSHYTGEYRGAASSGKWHFQRK